MRQFVHTMLGILLFAIVTIAGAAVVAYLVKSFLQLAVEGRYLFLACIYILALTNSWLLIQLKIEGAKNIVVFGGVLIVGIIAFIELTVFSRSTSIYQLYYSFGLVPLMYVFANYRINVKRNLCVS